MSSQEQKVLIVDDEPQMRKLLKMTVENEGYRAITAINASEGLSFTLTHKPDLLILDLGLPDFNGKEVIHKIREWSEIPIIVLSVLDDSEVIVEALSLGADDYMTKPFDANELMARVKVCLRRSFKKEHQASVFEYKHLKVDFAARIVYKSGEELKLTSTEYDLLKLFIKNANRVITNKQILKEIWGPSATNSQYPRVYVRYLRQKLEIDSNNPDIITTEAGVGYRMKIKG